MKGVIYARYSSDKQTEQSIDGQLRVCKQYCKNQDIDIIDIYVDRATSAAKNIDKRTDFLRMIKDSERRQFEFVICYKLDRFARNRFDSATYKTKLKKNGVRVISATENISENPEGIILESVLEGMAEFYSKELSQKVTRGMYESALKAQSTGGSIPIGYKVVNKKLEIDPLYSPLVTEAFEMYASGHTIHEIYTKFNNKGYRTKRGAKFNQNSFKTMFSNKKYIGTYVYNNQVEIPNAVPSIIDKETFNVVQEKLKLNAKAPGRGKAVVNYLLTQKLFCGHCGRPMVGESANKDGVRYHYYACSGKKRFHDCKKKNLRKDDIERCVVADTITLLTEENINLIADIACNELEREKNNNTVIISIKNQIKEIERSIGGLLKAFEHGAVSESLTNRLNELELQKKDVAKRLRSEEKNHPLLLADHVLYWLHSFLDGDVNDINYQRRVIDLLVNSVFVYDDSDGYKITITYNLTKDNVHTLNISDLTRFGSPNRKS